MKPVITIDPRLLQLLGNKLYSSHPLPIVVRELLQNARDACVRANVDPKIAITIKATDDLTEVVCEDNGIGMTAEQIVSDFLCLGNTSKMFDESAVGGFGIAKAALMRNPEWRVESLDNYIDQTSIFEGKDMEKIPFRQGTRVTVLITDKTYYTNMRQALAMIYFSEVSVDLKVKWHSLSYHDENAGWPEDLDVTFMREGSEWQAFKFDEKYIAEVDETFKGLSIIRLNGLVQYVKPTWSDRAFNLIFEISPKCRPDDKDYPLTMSREDLTGAVKNDVLDLITECDANPLSSSVNFATAPAVLRDGFMMRGKRGYTIPEEEQGVGRVIASLAVGETENRHQALLLRDYDESVRDVRKDAKILKLWRAMILECTTSDDVFGVGLIINPQIHAGRIVENGKAFYMINPDTLHSVSYAESKVMLMHMLACHEAAHFRWFNHGEQHTAEQAQIFIETIDIVVSNMKEFKRLLR